MENLLLIQEEIFAFIGHYGYVGIFGSLMLGIIGLPVPDELLLIFSGYLISQGNLNYVLTVLVSMIGSFAGMTVSYLVGQKLGYPLLEKYGAKIHITKEKLAHTHRWFQRFGKFAVTFGYFIPGIRHLTAYFAGIGKWSYGRFFLYAIPGALIWVITFITLGTYLGEHWHRVTETIHHYIWVCLSIIVTAALAVWYIKRKGNQKSRENGTYKPADH
jgi:membrane protein DedA with SNARE-associated domain